jgi:hypothetical protein
MEKKLSELPESEVTVTMTICKKCSNPFAFAVTHMMSKDTKKEIAKDVSEGHNIKTVPLLEYRELIKNGDYWCDCYSKTKK